MSAAVQPSVTRRKGAGLRAQPAFVALASCVAFGCEGFETVDSGARDAGTVDALEADAALVADAPVPDDAPRMQA